MGVVFALMYLLYLRTDRSATWAMVLLSPAVLLHPTTAFVYQGAGPRKELLVFVALSVAALGYRRRHWFGWGLGGLGLFILERVHEASALMLPAFVYLVWKGSESSPAPLKRNLLVAGYAIVAALVVVLAWLFPGNAGIQQEICAAWAERGVSAACDGEALGALTLTPSAALEWFRTHLPEVLGISTRSGTGRRSALRRSVPAEVLATDGRAPGVHGSSVLPGVGLRGAGSTWRLSLCRSSRWPWLLRPMGRSR